MERVHTMFYKRVLGVKRARTSCKLYSEIGIIYNAINVSRQFYSMLNTFWVKLLKTDNCTMREGRALSPFFGPLGKKNYFTTFSLNCFIR